MSIRPIDLNGMIQNTNEVQAVKANEDIRPELQQTLIETEFENQSLEDTTRVTEQENAAEENMNSDEGSGTGYDTQFRGKNGKKKKQEIKGTVRKLKPHGSFDMTI